MSRRVWFALLAGFAFGSLPDDGVVGSGVHLAIAVTLAAGYVLALRREQRADVGREKRSYGAGYLQGLLMARAAVSGDVDQPALKEITEVIDRVREQQRA